MKLTLNTDFEYLAMDAGGAVVFFKKRPALYRFTDFWGCTNSDEPFGAACRASIFTGFPTDIPWRESLHRLNKQTGEWERV